MTITQSNAKIEKTDPAELADMLDELRSLDPAAGELLGALTHLAITDPDSFRECLALFPVAVTCTDEGKAEALRWVLDRTS